MIEKKNVKKLAWVAVALVIMVLSMTVVSKAASNPENHKKTIEALDEKKADILKLTATSAAASTAIAAIPGDVMTAKQLIRASADTKRHGGVVVQIGVISVESQAVHHFVRI